jgi:hypothetical protein
MTAGSFSHDDPAAKRGADITVDMGNALSFRLGAAREAA